VLGDADAQAKIRKDNPDKSHCYLLRDHAFACCSLPFDISGSLGEFKAGGICPNNPYVRFAEEIARQESMEPLLQRAGELYRASKVGALGIENPSVEITMAYTYAEWIEQRRTEALWQATSSNSLLK